MVTLHEPTAVLIGEIQADQKLVAKVLDHFRRGNVLVDNGDFADALKEYDAALLLVGDDPTILNNLGVALGFLGRFEDALAAYERALAVTPEDHVTLHNRGVALARLGRFAEAVEAYQQALRVKGDESGTLANQALALAHLGRYREALVALDHSLQLNPADEGIASCRQKVLGEFVRTLARKGVLHWGGGKPEGSHTPVPITPGRPVSDYVIEDRR